MFELIHKLWLKHWNVLAQQMRRIWAQTVPVTRQRIMTTRATIQRLPFICIAVFNIYVYCSFIKCCIDVLIIIVCPVLYNYWSLYLSCNWISTYHRHLCFHIYSFYYFLMLSALWDGLCLLWYLQMNNN